MTGIAAVRGSRLRLAQTVKPSVPGIITSSRIRSGLPSTAIRTASSPFCATSRSISLSFKYAMSRPMEDGWSSTLSKIFFVFFAPLLFRLFSRL